MLTQTQPIILTRPDIVENLTRIRQEWEALAGGKTLIEVEASVGLLLVDFVNALELGPAEQGVVLGEDLIEDLSSLYDARWMLAE